MTAQHIRRPIGHRIWNPRVRQRMWAHAPQIAAGLAAGIPVIGSTVKAVRAGWVPAGDDGIIATRGFDVLSAHTPLVGQYSEAGLVIKGQVMHSPGPMLYWLIALPARYGSVASIAVTMCVVNVLAIVACVALARRRGGLILMFAAAVGIALMCQSLPTEAMHDIWNPAAGLFSFLALIFICWSLACGEHRLLPIMALVASFVVQTHLMYAAPTAVLLLVGCGGLLLRTAVRARAAAADRREGDPQERAVTQERSQLPRTGGRVWPWALAALVVAAVCWSEPAIDQIEHNPGNLAMIVRTAEHREPKLGATVGWHAVVRSVGLRPWWLYVPASEWERKFDVLATPSRVRSDSAIAILAALALAGLIGALARRFALLTAALIGAGLCAAIGWQAALNPSAKLLAETLGYTMWWGSELGLWVWLILAWALWLGLAGLLRPALPTLGRRLRRGPSGDRPGSPAGAESRLVRMRKPAVALASLASLAVVVAVGKAVAATDRPASDSHSYEYRPIWALAREIERAIPPGETIAYHLGPLDLGTQPMEPAIRFLLVRHGDRPLANGSLPRLGPYYEQGDRPVQMTLYLADGSSAPRHMTLAGQVRFRSPWGREVLSAWVSRDQRRVAGTRVTLSKVRTSRR